LKVSPSRLQPNVKRHKHEKKGRRKGSKDGLTRPRINIRKYFLIFTEILYLAAREENIYRKYFKY